GARRPMPAARSSNSAIEAAGSAASRVSSLCCCGRPTPLAQVVARLPAALPDAGGAARPASQVIELRPAHPASADHFNANARRVDQERALDADTVRSDAPHSEGLVQPAPTARDHHAFEGLRARAVTLNHLDVHPHGVAWPELGNVIFQVGGFDLANDVNHSS